MCCHALYQGMNVLTTIIHVPYSEGAADVPYIYWYLIWACIMDQIYKEEAILLKKITFIHEYIIEQRGKQVAINVDLAVLLHLTKTLMESEMHI